MATRIPLILILSLLVSPGAYAQQEYLDSLRNVFRTERDPHKKIDAFYEIATDRSFDNPDVGLAYADSIEDMARKSGYKKGMAMALHLRGFTHEDKGEYDKAMDLFQQELDIFLELKDLKEQATALTNIGSAWSSMGRQDSAVTYYLKAMTIDEMRGDSFGVSLHHNNIGAIYSDEGVFDKALEHFNKALAMRQAMKLERKYAQCYSYLATLYGRMKHFDKAEAYGKTGIEYALKFNNLSLAGIIANTLGSNYNDQKKYAEALPWLEKTVEYWQPLNNELYDTYAFYNLAEAYAGLGNASRALEYADKGFEIVKRLNLDFQYELYYKVYAQIYEVKGDMQLAYDWYKKYVAVADSIFRQDNTKKVAQMEAQYQVQKKEAQLVKQQLEIEKQSGQKRIILFTSLGLLLLTVATFQYFRSKQRLKQREAELQARLNETETKRLQELDAVKSTFFANISHEFRTPLTLIMSPVEQMMDGTLKGDVSKYYRIIHRNGKRLLHLVNDMLDLSKLESGKLKLQVATGRIDAFTRATAGAFESLAARQQVDLIIETSAKEEVCYFDRPKLESMLSNLISNAFKFTGEGGKVKVTEEKRGVNTIFTITDTGIGMSPQQVEHLFDRFSQTTVSELQHGSGIGLALARELAILHGGDISVQSEEGRGSVFTLTVRTDKDFFKADEITSEAIPIMAEPSYSQLPTEPSKSEMVTPTSMHEVLNSADLPVVLVVEDNPDVRGYISDIISGTYKVVTAEHGKIGLEKALDQLPDLIITDIMMPEMDGTQLCSHLKENEKTSHIPVVMLTARADQADRLEGLHTGADDYLIKPFQAQELLARVKNLIEQRRKLQAYYRKTISGFAMPPGEEQSLEAKFLGKVRAAVEDNLDDENFSVVELGKIVGMSRSQLHRKLTALTGFSPNEVIRNMRLEYARRLLESKSGTVSEIAYRSGFSSPAYFVKCFREYFGQTPGEIS